MTCLQVATAVAANRVLLVRVAQYTLEVPVVLVPKPERVSLYLSEISKMSISNQSHNDQVRHPQMRILQARAAAEEAQGLLSTQILA